MFKRGTNSSLGGVSGAIIGETRTQAVCTCSNYPVKESALEYCLGWQQVDGFWWATPFVSQARQWAVLDLRDVFSLKICTAFLPIYDECYILSHQWPEAKTCWLQPQKSSSHAKKSIEWSFMSDFPIRGSHSNSLKRNANTACLFALGVKEAKCQRSSVWAGLELTHAPTHAPTGFCGHGLRSSPPDFGQARDLLLPEAVCRLLPSLPGNVLSSVSPTLWIDGGYGMLHPSLFQSKE